MLFKLVVVFGLFTIVARCAPVNLDKVKKLLYDPQFFDYYQKHGVKPGDDELDGFGHYIKDTIKNFKNWQPKLQDISSPEYQELVAAQKGNQQIPTDENELFDKYLQTLYNADKESVTTTITSVPSTATSTTTLAPPTSASTTIATVSSTPSPSTTSVVPSPTDLESKFSNLDKEFNSANSETPSQISTQQPVSTSTTNLPPGTTTSTTISAQTTTTPTVSSTSASRTTSVVPGPTDLESKFSNLDKQFQSVDTANPEIPSQVSTQQPVSTTTTNLPPSSTTSTTTQSFRTTTTTVSSTSAPNTSLGPSNSDIESELGNLDKQFQSFNKVYPETPSQTSTHQPVITSTSTLPPPSSTYPAVSSIPVPSVSQMTQLPAQTPVNPQTPRKINIQQKPTQKLSFSDDDLDLLDQMDKKHYPKSRPRTISERVNDERAARVQAANAHYSFGFNVDDDIEGGSQQRVERMKNGKVYGKYSYDDGFSYVTRYYVADENGFRIIRQYSASSVKQNTPLTGDASVEYSGDNMPANYRITVKDVKRGNSNKFE